MRFHTKIYLVLVTVLLVGATYFYTKQKTDELLYGHSQVLHYLAELELLNQRLNGEVWSTAYRLYHNYDKAHLLINEMRALAEELRDYTFLMGDEYKPFWNKFDNSIKLLVKKEKALQRYATLNSLVKNSVAHVPGLTHRYARNFTNDDQAYLQDLSEATSFVFLASNAMDAELLAGFKQVLKRLNDREFVDQDRANFNRVFLSHARVIDKYLSQYIPVFEQLIGIPIDKELHDANELYIEISKKQANHIHDWTLVITFAFIASLGLIAMMLVSLDKRHLELSSLHATLKNNATIDQLTGLKNRFSFDHLIKSDTRQTLIVLNIDGFKNINNFYGHEAGDNILVQLSRFLHSELAGLKHALFRLGGDDFGILLESGVDESSVLARSLIRKVENNPFYYQDNPISINVTAGLSATTPLLETANLTVNRIKHSRLKFLSYDSELGKSEMKRDNLGMIRLLKEAINNDRVKPFFMPIHNNSKQRIERYECLVRIVNEDGKLLMPGDFLPIAREGRLNADLTRIMIDKSFSVFADSDLEFSVNLAIEDILDPEVTEFLIYRLEQSPDIGRRLILEILESEEIKSYNAVADFVRRVEGYGCRIAIDDFGSGYSNLRHLLELNVHTLKIDGSLIRNIVTDPHAEQAVLAITTLAHKVGINSIVAEFVCSQEIHERVVEMGIEYSQGFFIGEPDDSILIN
ncbi:MAG: EAL domain-containing protein [Candidatus Thiodiazotropha lotti]|nr:EAL domain-containing protein [Candidatus Thiodiazotropha lotti]MCG7985176.1 EAL domain-containing protein [Candidatus Thiodiazotropha lotti]